MSEQTIELSVEGMSCDHCRNSVQRLLDNAYGVVESKVELEPGKAIVTLAAGKTSRESIIETINQSEIYTAS